MYLYYFDPESNCILRIDTADVLCPASKDGVPSTTAVLIKINTRCFLTVQGRTVYRGQSIIRDILHISLPCPPTRGLSADRGGHIQGRLSITSRQLQSRFHADLSTQLPTIMIRRFYSTLQCPSPFEAARASSRVSTE